MLLLFLLFLLAVPCWADSPVTSTDFWQVYQEIPLVRRAHETHTLDEEMLQFLISDAPLDHKAALVNGLGWDTPRGVYNSGTLEGRMLEKYHLKEPRQLVSRLSPEDSFCMGYLKALDSVSAPSFALPYLRSAQKRLPKSYMVVLLTRVVEAQDPFLDHKWGRIWPPIEKVTRNEGLKLDIRPEARDAILKYMRLYKDEAR